jgi:hypothetical protein
MNTNTITVGGHDVECGDGVAAVVAAAGLDLSGDSWYEQADETEKNETYRVCRWELTNGRSLYVDLDGDIPLWASVHDGDMSSHLEAWHWNDLGYESLGEWMASWGYDGLHWEHVADEDYHGPCRVWEQHHYFVGTCGAPSDGYARDERGDVLEFASICEAQKYVDECYDEDPIRLAHGQHASDTLTIVKPGV